MPASPETRMICPTRSAAIRADRSAARYGSRPTATGETISLWDGIAIALASSHTGDPGECPVSSIRPGRGGSLRNRHHANGFFTSLECSFQHLILLGKLWSPRLWDRLPRLQDEVNNRQD